MYMGSKGTHIGKKKIATLISELTTTTIVMRPLIFIAYLGSIQEICSYIVQICSARAKSKNAAMQQDTYDWA